MSLLIKRITELRQKRLEGYRKDDDRYALVDYILRHSDRREWLYKMDIEELYHRAMDIPV